MQQQNNVFVSLIVHQERYFEFTENANYSIEIIEKKAELVDYVQKTFEVMGIIN